MAIDKISGKAYTAIDEFSGVATSGIDKISGIDGAATADIIQNGLILHLDAGNTNSFNSAAAGSTWYDLTSNNNDFTFVNTESGDWSSDKGGIINFDGSNEKATSSSFVFPAQTSTSSFTISLWLNIPSSGAGFYDVLFGNRYGGQSSPLRFMKVTPAGFEYYNSGTMTQYWTRNSWINITVVKNGSAFSMYQNASQTDTRTSTQTMPTNPVGIAGDPDRSTTENPAVSYSVIAVYNRALSSTEITSNYNTLAGRYV